MKTTTFLSNDDLLEIPLAFEDLDAQLKFSETRGLSSPMPFGQDDTFAQTQSEVGVMADDAFETSLVPVDPVQPAKDLFQPVASIPPLYAFFPTNEIVGTFGDDTLYGNSEFAWDPELGTVMTFTDDLIYGLEGDDKLFGQGGDDFLSGGEGNDEMHGGSGDDIIAGGVGLTNDGIDQMFGGSGADIFLLGDDGKAHYQDEDTYNEYVGYDYIEFLGIGKVYGLTHYTIIKDFTSEDTIAAPDVEHGTYHIDNANYSGSGDANVQDTLIYFGSEDPFLPLDLVAVVVDYSGPVTVEI